MPVNSGPQQLRQPNTSVPVAADSGFSGRQSVEHRLLRGFGHSLEQAVYLSLGQYAGFGEIGIRLVRHLIRRGEGQCDITAAPGSRARMTLLPPAFMAQASR